MGFCWATLYCGTPGQVGRKRSGRALSLLSGTFPLERAGNLERSRGAKIVQGRDENNLGRTVGEEGAQGFRIGPYPLRIRHPGSHQRTSDPEGWLDSARRPQGTSGRGQGCGLHKRILRKDDWVSWETS